MSFTGIQVAHTYTQINNARPEKVFPLLCPVREKDWIEGWEYTLIHSVSGVAEKGCVFTTPHHGKANTVWYITEHNPHQFVVEFVRVTPNEEVVKIAIKLSDSGNETTQATITYEYTGLNEAKNQWIVNDSAKDFEENMIEWEKAINHYLETGSMLTN